MKSDWSIYREHKSKEFINSNGKDLINLNKVLNLIGEKIETWELNSDKTRDIESNKKLVVLKISLLSNKKNNFKAVLDYFLKMSKGCATIIIITHLKTFSISMNLEFLNNSLVKEVLKKYVYTTNFYNCDMLKTFIDWDDVNNNSIVDIFDETARRIICRDKYEEMNFTYSMTWDVIYKMVARKNLERKIKIINNKIKSTYNEQERLKLNQELREMKKKKDELNKEIDRQIS